MITAKIFERKERPLWVRLGRDVVKRKKASTDSFEDGK